MAVVSVTLPLTDGVDFFLLNSDVLKRGINGSDGYLCRENAAYPEESMVSGTTSTYSTAE